MYFHPMRYTTRLYHRLEYMCQNSGQYCGIVYLITFDRFLFCKNLILNLTKSNLKRVCQTHEMSKCCSNVLLTFRNCKDQSPNHLQHLKRAAAYLFTSRWWNINIHSFSYLICSIHHLTRRSIPSSTYSLRCYIRLRQGFFSFFFSKKFWKTFKTCFIFFWAENEKLPGFCSVFFQLCGDDDN